MKNTFVIEWPDDHGEGWMNVWNLITVLQNSCPNTPFTVSDVGSCKSNRITESCKPLPKPSIESIHIAGRVWQDQDMLNVEMDSEAALKIARILDRVEH